jgi:hypothetical protein
MAARSAVSRACSTSVSRACPSAAASHFSSAHSGRVVSRSMMVPKACSALRARRVGHPHLVHGVGLITADQRVIMQDGRHLIAQIGEHDFACGRMPGQLRFRRCPGGGQPAGQRPLQFGLGGGGPGAGPAQLLVDRGQQGGAAGDQLGLDLIPHGGGGSVGWLGRDVVGGDLGECLAGAVGQPEHAAAGLDAHHRRQRRTPDAGPDQSGELFRHQAIGAGQGQAYLVPGVRARGQFQVPPRILASRAPPQRDARTDQPQIRGVVVDGVQELLR